jgi:hypothetical protein
MYLLLLIFLTLIGGILYTVWREYDELGISLKYEIVFVAEIIFINLGYLFGKTVHFHHYVIGIVMVSMMSGSSRFALASGYFNGWVIEGGARWGYDPIWVGDIKI